MRPLRTVPFVAFAFLMLGGCAAGSVSPPPQNQSASVVPPWLATFRGASFPQHLIRYAAKPKTAIYAAQFYGSDLLAYRNPNQQNAGPVCSVAATSVNGFSVDHAGDLVVPSGDPTQVTVYHGLCGKALGMFSDPYGQASDAASANAASGTIVVGNIEASKDEKAGNIAVCTLAEGCTRELKSKSITYYGGGVALNNHGDCWISSEDNASLSSATLTYFKKCAGAGKAVKGWKNSYYGGLIVDKAGNLISIDFNSRALWVYKGCNPDCTVIGGPFTLEGNSFYGNLNSKGNELALGDFQLGEVDVYAYAPTSLTYLYSFTADLTPSGNVEAAGFTPAL